MKRKVVIGLLGILFMGSALFVSGCNSEIKEPTISYKSYEIQKISPEGIDVIFLFEVDNPNGIGLNNIKMDYVLSVDGIEAMTGQNSGLTAKANQITQWELPAKFTYTQVFNTWSNLAKRIIDGEKSVPFELATTFRAKVMMLEFSRPVTATGELPLPQIDAQMARQLFEKVLLN